MVTSARIFTKHRSAQRHYVHYVQISSTGFHPDRTMDMGGRDRNVSTRLKYSVAFTALNFKKFITTQRILGGNLLCKHAVVNSYNETK